MTLRRWYSPAVLALVAAVTTGEEPVDRSFTDASWVNESSTQAAARVRSELAEWRPVPASPPPSCAAPLASVAGVWIGVNDPTLSCLQLIQDSPGHYTLRFVADGHAGGWRMRRTASLKGPLLQLSGPVLDYLPPPYDGFYALAVGDERFLIPVTALPQVEAQVAKGGCSSIRQTNISATVFRPAFGDSEAYCKGLGLDEEW